MDYSQTPSPNHGLRFSRSDGYVALPAGLMDLDLAPGAFRLLVELCRMANAEGQCWPSLGQLSARIGRSRASLSAYLDALRAADLVQTERQIMANGYNYRLKYTVAFWKAWRASLKTATRGSGSQSAENASHSASVQRETVAPQSADCIHSSESSDQPIERRVNSKNQIQKNHCVRADEELSQPPKLQPLVQEWTALARGAPFPALNGDVSQELLRQTRLAIKSQCPPVPPNDVNDRLRRIWSSLGVDLKGTSLPSQVTLLRGAKATDTDLDGLRCVIQEEWQAHWRKPPTEQQFSAMWEKARARAPQSRQIAALAQFLRRWEFAQKRLHPCAAYHSLAA